MPRTLLTALLSCVLSLSFTLQAAAQSIIRDAEIERGLRELAAPLLAKAGLPRSIRIIVINDSSMNAFVADARHIFLHSGLIMRLNGPAELQAVIAHEAAHVTNGHKPTAPAGLPQLIVQARDGRERDVMQDLAQAYADKGGIGRSCLATAEHYAKVG